jgi:predicted N-acetyltransferase YhbS
MLSKIKIRPFESADNLNELTILLNTSYKQLADKGFKFLASHQDSLITQERINEGKCFVAIFENKLIGTITYRSPKQASGCEWYNQSFVASYGQFAVHPQFQKSGIGSKLIKLVEEQAKSDNAKEIAVDTAEGATELISYYSKRDYKFVAYTQWKETNYRSVLLSKKL